MEESQRLNDELLREIIQRNQIEGTLRKEDDETTRLAQENAAMAEIVRIVSSALDLQEVYEAFVNQVKKLIPFDRISINTISYEDNTFRVSYLRGPAVAERGQGTKIPISGSAVEVVIQTRSSLLIGKENRKEAFERFLPLRPHFQSGLRTVMLVPLIARDRVIGVFNIFSYSIDSYEEEDLKKAERVAYYIAGAIANARLYAERKLAEEGLRKSEEEARRLARENAVLAEIGRIIGSSLSIEEVFKLFSQEAKKLLLFDWISISMINHEDKTFIHRYTEGEPVPRRNHGDTYPIAGTFGEAAIQSGQGLVLLLEDANEALAKYPGLLPNIKVGVRSFMAVPLISRDRVIGLLRFRSKMEKAYSEESLRLAENIGRQIAGAIANAKLYDERQQMIEALRDSEEKYRLLVQNANDAIFIAQDGVVKFPNAKTLELTGYSAEELSATPFVNHIHPDDRELLLKTHDKIIKEKATLRGNYSLRIRNKSGEELWVEPNSVFVLWEGRPGTLNFIRDMTEQKRLEAQFLQAQKMEALGQLAGGVAHDFNNILTLINTHAQLALLEKEDCNPWKEKMECILNAGWSAANLTRQLLAFSRRQTVEMKVIDLNMVLQDLGKMMTRVIRENIELSIISGENLARIKADSGQIEQVVLNLVVNAKDAMPSGGKLTIETANAELDDEYAQTHLGLKPGRYVMLAVSDTGGGMTREIRERIFEPFFTTKEKHQGTGLGLSTVYGVVKHSGGDIWVYSEPGHGTTFKIYLPQVDKVQEDESNKKAAQNGLPPGWETILVVEDEEEVRKMAADILRRQGYLVLDAPNGDDALQICERRKENVHLLVTDVVMPRLNGPELAIRLKYFYPDMKTLFMSGYTEKAILQQGLLVDEVPFLHKPFSVETLTGKVRELLDG